MVCAQQNDAFTLSVANGGVDGYGNNMLTYPVGLITADEVAYAGGAWWANNTSYYLYYSTAPWWTMSPFYYDVSNMARVFFVGVAGGLLNDTAVSYTKSAFPVISLNSDVRVTQGDGSTTAPYVIE